MNKNKGLKYFYVHQDYFLKKIDIFNIFKFPLLIALIKFILYVVKQHEQDFSQKDIVFFKKKLEILMTMHDF